MSTDLLGADADELERIAQQLRSAAAELEGHAGSLTTTLRSVAWVGGVATRFGSQWNSGHRPRIIATATEVRDAAAQLDRNAAEQRIASRADAGSLGDVGPTPSGEPPDRPPMGPPAPDSGGPPAPDPAVGDGGVGGSSSSVEPDSSVVDQLDEVLKALGLGRSELELIAEHTDLLEGLGLDKLLDVLSGDDFLAVLKGLDTVLDVGAVVLNLVSDFADHPHLPFDERIVHALADAAVNFGIDQGIEYVANFLAQSATAALLPGLGVALAPFVGKAAGLLADVVMSELVDLVDDATDIVDVIADAAVESYRSVKETFGVILDAAGAVIDVADAAIDLTVDTAGAIVDVGGAVAGGVVDAGSTIGDWLGL